MARMKYFIKTFGCQMNESDSEWINGFYQSKGFELAKKIEEASEVVINTCSVRESAENRVFGLINNLGKLKKKAQGFKLILTGCMLRYPLKELKRKLPLVDEFRPISFYLEKAPFAIREFEQVALLPISQGCNNFCSYCVVPYARGKEASVDFDQLIDSVKKLVELGYKEIVLLGQNVNSYGLDFKDKNKNFARLLRELHRIEDLKKISFLTSNPWDLTDEIIAVMKQPKISREFHFALQSGDDQILKRMNRRYTSGDFLRLVKKLRKEIPGIKISTDIIVGFPGETGKQFENTVEFCREIGFVRAFVNRYSPRPGTAAFKLGDPVPAAEKKKRWLTIDKLINRKKTK